MDLQSLSELWGKFLVPVVQKCLGCHFPSRSRRVKASGRRIRSVEELYLIISQGTARTGKGVIYLHKKRKGRMNE